MGSVFCVDFIFLKFLVYFLTLVNIVHVHLQIKSLMTCVVIITGEWYVEIKGT